MFEADYTIITDLESLVFFDETGRLLVGPAADVVGKAAAESIVGPHFDAAEAMRRIAAALSASLAEGQDLGEGAAPFRQVARAAVDAVTGRRPGEKAPRCELEDFAAQLTTLARYGRYLETQACG